MVLEATDIFLPCRWDPELVAGSVICAPPWWGEVQGANVGAAQDQHL